jgi:hypothetical protein
MAKETLLGEGQWVEELLIRGSPDGKLAAHVKIGASVDMPGAGKQLAVSPPLPVALLAGEQGVPLADIIGKVTLKAVADLEAARVELAEAVEDRDRLRGLLAGETAQHAVTRQQLARMHSQAMRRAARDRQAPQGEAADSTDSPDAPAMGG